MTRPLMFSCLVFTLLASTFLDQSAAQVKLTDYVPLAKVQEQEPAKATPLADPEASSQDQTGEATKPLVEPKQEEKPKPLVDPQPEKKPEIKPQIDPTPDPSQEVAPGAVDPLNPNAPVEGAPPIVTPSIEPAPIQQGTPAPIYIDPAPVQGNSGTLIAPAPVPYSQPAPMLDQQVAPANPTFMPSAPSTDPAIGSGMMPPVGQSGPVYQEPQAPQMYQQGYAAPQYEYPQQQMGSNGLGIQFGAWAQAGYTTYNTGQFNNHPDNLDLNQLYFYLEKVADGSQGFDWGFRADYVYGTDGPDTQAFGGPPGSWDTDWTNGGFYGSAIPQLYGEIAMGDISVKAGHFYTIMGYEVVTSPDNFFYSHSFTMFNFEPFTHTGVLGQFNMGDVTLYGGYTLGWDTGFDEFDGDGFLGGVNLNLGDAVDVFYSVYAGQPGFGTAFDGFSHSLVVQMGLSDRLSYVLQSDYNDYTDDASEHQFSSVVGNQLPVLWNQ